RYPAGGRIHPNRAGAKPAFRLLRQCERVAYPAHTRSTPINNREFDRRPQRDLGPRLNHRIRVPEVRVIDAEGQQLGVMATRDALNLAREQGLDLVEVAPMAHPPVCRILDYGKHKYDESKKQRQARKNAHATEIKGIRIKPGTESHDLEFKLKDTIRFLQE